MKSLLSSRLHSFVHHSLVRWAGVGLITGLVGCTSHEVAREVRPSAVASTENEAVEVVLGARTVRVRCESACGPLEHELETLQRSCARDPLASPSTVAIGGTPLSGLGCCEQAERGYQLACGDELSRCRTGWLAACERRALTAVAAEGRPE